MRNWCVARTVTRGEGRKIVTFLLFFFLIYLGDTRGAKDVQMERSYYFFVLLAVSEEQSAPSFVCTCSYVYTHICISADICVCPPRGKGLRIEDGHPVALSSSASGERKNSSCFPILTYISSQGWTFALWFDLRFILQFALWFTLTLMFPIPFLFFFFFIVPSLRRKFAPEDTPHV